MVHQSGLRFLVGVSGSWTPAIKKQNEIVTATSRRNTLSLDIVAPLVGYQQSARQR